MLELLTWTATGLGVGWLVRTLMRSRREFGYAGDLVTGWLGALIGGWLLRRLDVIAPDNTAGHVLVALIGAAALMAGIRTLREAAIAARAATATAAPMVSVSIDERLKQLGLGQFELRTLVGFINRERLTDPNQSFDAQASVGDRIADRVAAFGGSWTFIGLFAIVMLSWMTLNQELDRPFDPYPFILLNLVLSCLAALQAPVIMMSQNRQAARDRSDARNDYEVNLRAEMEIAAVHAKLDLLREQQWVQLVQTVEEQQRLLSAIHARLEQFAPATGGASLDAES